MLVCVWGWGGGGVGCGGGGGVGGGGGGGGGGVHCRRGTLPMAAFCRRACVHQIPTRAMAEDAGDGATKSVCLYVDTGKLGVCART